MTDFDREADDASGKLNAWLQAHPRGSPLTKNDVQTFGSMVREFDTAAKHAEGELSRAVQSYHEKVRVIRQAALQQIETARGRPYGFLQRTFLRPAGAAQDVNAQALVRGAVEIEAMLKRVQMLGDPRDVAVPSLYRNADRPDLVARIGLDPTQIRDYLKRKYPQFLSNTR